MQRESVDTDTHQWAFDTAAAIREKRWEDVDWGAVAEEIEDVGKAERRELRSCLAQLMYHLLKSNAQPERGGTSWQRIIRNQSAMIQDLLNEQPSLRALLRERAFWQQSYRTVFLLAAQDDLPPSAIEQFPDECPFDIKIVEGDYLD